MERCAGMKWQGIGSNTRRCVCVLWGVPLLEDVALDRLRGGVLGAAGGVGRGGRIICGIIEIWNMV